MSHRVKIIRFIIYINELFFFYPKLRKFYKKQLTNKPLTVIDVGANRGQTIDFFLKNFNIFNLFAFEPNTILFRNLKQKYSRTINVNLHNLGVCFSKGKRLFNVNILDETSSFENINVKSQYAIKKAKILGVKIKELVDESYMVNTTNLNDFILETQLKNIDIIKIDVEGHEYEVLRGLFSKDLKTKTNYIQIEVHHGDMYSNNVTEINELLLLNNYKLLKSISHGFGNFSDLIYGLN